MRRDAILLCKASLLCALALAAAASPGTALPADAEKGTAPLPRLIQDLGSDDFSAREAASAAIAERLERLAEGGDPAALHEAMEALRRAAREREPEIRSQAEALLAPFLTGGLLWRSDAELPDMRHAGLLGPEEGIAVAWLKGNAARLTCLDARTGKARWDILPGDAIGQMHILPGGVLVCGAAPGDRWEAGLFEPRSGKQRWKASLPGGQAATISPDGGKALVHGYVPPRTAEERGKGTAELAQWLALLDLETGKVAWRKELPSYPVSLSFAGDGILAAGAQPDPWVLLLDPSNGTRRWEARDLPRLGVLRALPLGGSVLVGGYSDPMQTRVWLQLREPADGKVRWTLDPSPLPPDFPCEACALADGSLAFMSTPGGKVLCLEPGSGKIRWEQPTAEGLASHQLRPAPQGALVTVTGSKIPTFAALLDAGTGKPRWKELRASPGDVLLPKGSGEGLLIVDAGSPARRGAGPHQPGTARAFVLDPATGEARSKPWNLEGRPLQILPQGLLVSGPGWLALYRLHDADAEEMGR